MSGAVVRLPTEWTTPALPSLSRVIGWHAGGQETRPPDVPYASPPA
jgi:hypothetical protein